jgi:hypothetical protein
MKKLLCKQSLLGILAFAACVAAPAGFMRANFTWDGGGTTDSFSDGCNWGAADPCGPYPDDTGDDATFPWKTTGAWACDLTSEQIRDMTIEGSVYFDDGGDDVELSVTRLYIEPTEGDIEITVSGTTQIVVD